MLIYYKVLFMFEIIVAELLFSYHLPKRKYFWVRLISSSLFCLFIAYIFPIPDKVGYTWWYISIMFFLLFACSFLAIFLSFKNLCLKSCPSAFAMSCSKQISAFPSVPAAISSAIAATSR